MDVRIHDISASYLLTLGKMDYLFPHKIMVVSPSHETPKRPLITVKFDDQALAIYLQKCRLRILLPVQRSHFRTHLYSHQYSLPFSRWLDANIPLRVVQIEPAQLRITHLPSSMTRKSPMAGRRSPKEECIVGEWNSTRASLWHYKR